MCGTVAVRKCRHFRCILRNGDEILPPRNTLLKPASGDCNLRCRYCFYHDEMCSRENSSYGRMSPETLEAVISKAMAEAEGQCTFGFQGGEPTLAGLPFFEQVIALQKKYGRPDLQVYNALQTNGTLLDEAWAAFLREHRFLVGLSLDGDESLHNLYRVDAAGRGTFSRVEAAADLLRRHGVEFNILTVVTAQTAKNIRRVYRYFQRKGFSYQQYIPCLDPLEDERGSQKYSLTPQLYGRFLVTLFDLWYEDRMAGRFMYNRYFDNLLGIRLGCQPEACGMLGHCGIQYAVEADGSVYPCDFYMLDGYCIGNFRENTLAEMDARRQELGFLQKSAQTHEDCHRCPWVALCRGGCRRDRPELPGDVLGKNYYCPAFQEFFAHAVPKLTALANRIKQI